MNLGPFKVICEKGVVVLGEEGDECFLTSVAIEPEFLICLVCVHIESSLEIRVQK